MAEYVFALNDEGGLEECRERIVRCRDCRHGDPFCDSSSFAGMIDCALFAEWDYYNDKPGVCPVKPDFFCAHGEMEED